MGKLIYLKIFVLKEVDILVPLESAEEGEFNGTLFIEITSTVAILINRLFHLVH